MSKFLCGECIHNSDKGGGCLIPKNLGYVDNCNRYLPKDKPIVLTNEEWFCSLPTEEKADLMSRMLGCSNCPIPKDGRSCMGTYSGCWNEIIKWLKQPHGEVGK